MDDGTGAAAGPGGEQQAKARATMAATTTKRPSDPERLQGLLEKLKEENMVLREALDSERGAVRELKRRMAAELRTAREEEARRRSDCLCDLRTRLEHEYQEALQCQREAVAKSLHADLTCALHKKDAELRQERSAAHQQQEALQQQLRDALRLNLMPDHDSHRPARVVLHELKAQGPGGEQQAKVRSTMAVTTTKRPPDPERLQGLLDKLKEENAALREALNSERGAVRELKRRMAVELRTAHEQEARRRSDCLCDLRTRLEHEHQEALQGQRDAVARSLHADLTRALHEKDAELRQERSAAQRQQEVLQQQLRDALRLSASPDHDSHRSVFQNHGSFKIAGRGLKVTCELEKLRSHVEERDKEIAALRQAAKDKDDQLDHLTNRCRIEQMKPYYRFMELETVSEREETGDEDAPLPGSDVWSEEQVDFQHRCQVLESRLRRSETRVCRLHELRRTAADHAQQVRAEAAELREHNDLLEFRVLELEEALKQRLSRSTGSDMRDMWTDTESDDVSDSGMTSLPTSDELTSDTDLGVHDLKLERAFKDLSEFRLANNCFDKFPGRIVATVLPFTDISQPTNTTPTSEILDDTESNPSYTQLKNAECLQESGIFESEYVECGTQTDVSDLSGDLRSEIQKLTHLQECIENKQLLGSSGVNELAFCRERLQLLEAKVLVYESSGDRQARLLAERLQREVVLAAQVKELSGKVARLQADTLRLEEERCEYEEAENDTRLRCQKMEVKLQALSDKKSELQSLLQQERRCNTTLRNELADCDRARRDSGSFELQISKLEQRNYELEERAMELRHRLELEERVWPILLVWSVWKIVKAFQGPLALPFDRQSDSLQHGSSSKDTPALPKDQHVKRKWEDSMHSVLGEAPGPTFSEMKTTDEFPTEQRKSAEVVELPRSDSPSCGSSFSGAHTGLNPTDKHVESMLEHESLSKCDENEKAVEKASEVETRHLCTNEDCNTSEMLELWKARELELIYLRRISELEDEIILLKGQLNAVTYGTEKSNDASEKQGSEDPNDEAVDAIKLQDIEWMDRLDELAQAEINMQNRITELEQKETAYMETLRQADDLWSDLESGYKQQIQNMHENASRQGDEALELEQALADLQAALRRAEDDKTATGAKVAQLSEALAVADASMERLQREVDVVLKPKLSQERRLSADLQRDLAHKNETLEAMQDSFERENYFQIENLIGQLATARKDCIAANSECFKLKEEVEDLKNTVQELRTSLTKEKNEDEKTIVKLTNQLADKEQELKTVLMASRDALARSARDEIAEAEHAQDEVEVDDVEEDAERHRNTRHMDRVLDSEGAHCKQILQV